MLPVQELEPGFSRLIPVCLELPTPAGYVDNLYITPTGDLVLAECKLWRNPEARREVIVQIIDYAHSMATWNFSDLENAIRSAATIDGRQPPQSLFQLVEEEGELDEIAFTDAVSRNLRLGRMLLLIIGDGIREGVETLSDYLQAHAGFHFTLGIVEMPIYRLPQQGFVVQPRILAKTVNIERGIVRVMDGHVIIEPSGSTATRSSSERRTSISQERLFEAIAEQNSRLPDALRRFLDRAAERGVVSDMATKSLQIRWRSPAGTRFALGGISDKGEFITYSVNWVPDSIGRIDLAHEYLEQIAGLIGGVVRKDNKPALWYVAIDGKKPPSATSILELQDAWLEIIKIYTEKLTTALAQKESE